MSLFDGDNDNDGAGKEDPGASPWDKNDPPSVKCGVCGRLHGPGDPHCGQ